MSIPSSIITDLKTALLARPKRAVIAPRPQDEQAAKDRARYIVEVISLLLMNEDGRPPIYDDQQALLDTHIVEFIESARDRQSKQIDLPLLFENMRSLVIQTEHLDILRGGEHFAENVRYESMWRLMLISGPAPAPGRHASNVIANKTTGSPGSGRSTP